MSHEKKIVRLSMLKLRENGISSRERREKSSRIASSLINDLLLPATVRSVGLYYPVRGEVDTLSIFDFCRKNSITSMFPRIVSDDEMMFLPVNSRRELVKRKYGIYEPGVGAYTGEKGFVPDIVIVPGVAFDKNNFRIGYGKGYYDSYLSRHRPTLMVGFGYAFQVLERVPVDQWDVRLDLVLTENGWQGNYKNIFAGGSR